MGVQDIQLSEPVLPVTVVPSVASAVRLAQCLLDAGLHSLEIALRNSEGVRAIEAVGRQTSIRVGAGTVVDRLSMADAVSAGAHFIVCPGLDVSLVEMSETHRIPILPGTMTPTDVMRAQMLGFETVKYFPAEAAGGVRMLQALAGPFPAMRFVPTGGIRPEHLASYLGTGNVVAVGGTWIAPLDDLLRERWDDIATRARWAASQGRAQISESLS
jgi:2-dehydro-3-deoxyphosphogluconate aldolase/(4S)-4-hydroxy-2-oxoglutarate aldolase